MYDHIDLIQAHQIIRAVAAATFRPMEGRDFDGLAGAEPGTLIGERQGHAADPRTANRSPRNSSSSSTLWGGAGW